jgi:O-antigen ligase
LGREQIAGVALALYLISGSWSVARVAGVEPSPIWEPRTWSVMILVALALLPARARLRTTRSAVLPELAWLIFSAVAVTWAPDIEIGRALTTDLGLLIAAGAALHRLTLVGRIEVLANSLRLGLLVVLGGLMLTALAGGVSGGRLSVLGGGPNVFGRNMGMLCVITLERALFHDPRRDGRRQILPWVLLACVAAGLTTLSGSRGAMISTFAAVSLLLMLGRARLGRRLAVVLGVLGLFIALLLFTPLGGQVIEIFSSRVLDLLIGERYVSGRDRLYVVALEGGLEQPIIGNGLGSFPASTPWPYAHNLFLDAWYETGAIGVALLSLYLARNAREMLRLGSAGHELWIALAGLIFLSAQFSGGRYDARALLVFAAINLALPRVVALPRVLAQPRASTAPPRVRKP